MRPAADKALDGIEAATRARIAAKIDALAEDPHPHGVKKLAGPEELWRVRVGDYRIVYTIRNDVLLVLVVNVAHRREVYRRR